MERLATAITRKFRTVLTFG